MTRKKVNLAYISNDSVRKRALMHKKRGLTKKLDEIKVLCDIDACAVIYSPFNSTPEIWPPNSEVHKVIEKFEILTEEEQTEASVNHEEFLTQTITKDEKKVKRLTEDNIDKFMKEFMYACLNGNLGDLDMDDSARGNLCEFIDEYLKKLYHHRNVTLNNPHAS
ncbi:hypothetical protein BRARA_E00738 [Brassica rapa]|uniref:MADS-box domain-containing protein n=1 Tax=Brassica campestris TaxID=3711 RepID=A0A397ZBF6_BRACM|nr:hypothetical protein BRARA_E00738 [Brassica rapa]